MVEAPGTPSTTASARGADGLIASASPAKSTAVLEARVAELQVCSGTPCRCALSPSRCAPRNGRKYEWNWHIALCGSSNGDVIYLAHVLCATRRCLVTLLLLSECLAVLQITWHCSYAAATVAFCKELLPVFLTHCLPSHRRPGLNASVVAICSSPNMTSAAWCLPVWTCVFLCTGQDLLWKNLQVVCCDTVTVMCTGAAGRNAGGAEPSAVKWRRSLPQLSCHISC